MKHLHFIALMFLVLVLACNRPVETRHGTSLPSAASPQLQAIDSLMWRQPDSAFAQLRQFVASPQADSLDEFNVHYCQLLISELLYKNYCGQSNREELLQAVAYFDSLVRLTPHPPLKGGAQRAGDSKKISNPTPNLVFLDARAHYINGAGYYERDSVVEACKEYLKTLEVMEGHFEERELVGKKAQFMALTSTRLTELFSDFYLHNQTIYFGKKSLGYYNRFASISWQKAWMLTEIGSHYEMMDSFDTANLLYEDALMTLPDTNNITYRDIKTYQTVLSYKMGEQPEKSIELLRSIMVQADSDKEFYSRCMNIGEIYYHQSQFDSAEYYLNKVFHESPNANSKKQAAEWLAKLCKAQDKETDALKYAEFLVPFANVEENQSAIKSRLTEFYKSYTQQEQLRLHRHERLKDQRRLMVLLGIFVALMSCIIILYHKNKRRKQCLEEEIISERQTHRMEQAAMSGRLKRSNQELLELRGQIKQLDDLAAKTKTAASFNEEPICRLIMERVKEGQFKSKVNYVNYKDYALSKSNLLDLRLAADLHFNQFTRRLKTAYPQITNTDLDYCCLYLLGLTDSDVAALMQRSYNTVIERNGKMRKIIGSTSALPTTLMEIANDSHQFD